MGNLLFNRAEYFTKEYNSGSRDITEQESRDSAPTVHWVLYLYCYS